MTDATAAADLPPVALPLEYARTCFRLLCQADKAGAFGPATQEAGTPERAAIDALEAAIHTVEEAQPCAPPKEAD